MLKAGAVTAVGAMSGTSLDGVDAAQIVTDGVKILGFGPSKYRAYSEIERATLRAALGKWQTDDIAAARATIEAAHIEILSNFSDATLVGFHGQTLAHDPQGRGTHQCGDGAKIAESLGKTVVWDFRSADVQMGGEGAPLAPFFHFALSDWIGATEPLAFLNLGGVGNLTWIDPSYARPELPGALLAFDTGPANAPINDIMQSRRRQSFDADGALAAKGDVQTSIIAEFLENPFFFRMPPKSLDRDAFSHLTIATEKLSDEDAVATLTAAAAISVVRAMEHCPKLPGKLLVTGGGRHNPVLMQMLAAGLDCQVAPVEDVGLDGDMLEAQAFAFLAVRVARGLATSCASTTGVRAAVSGGTISSPG